MSGRAAAPEVHIKVNPLNLLYPSEAAKLLGVDTQTLLKWTKRGWMGSVTTPGGHRRYHRDEVMRIRAGTYPNP